MPTRKPKSKTNYAITRDGDLSIVKAHNIKSAMKFAREYWGTYRPIHVAKATDEEVSWFEAMGGSKLEVE